PLTVSGEPESVRVSAGLALFPADGRHMAELMKSADLALYDAKERGGDLIVNYLPKLRAAQEERLTVCANARRAFEDTRFVPIYQAKISRGAGEVTGFEALLRWRHPDGLRSPGALLPALQDPVLSRALCSAMLDGILVDMARWQAKGLPFGRIAFNASS